MLNKKQIQQDRGLSAVKSVKNNNTKFDTNKLVSKVVGILSVLISVSVYAQALPMMFIFTGAYLGIQPETSMNNIDSVIWILTSVALMLLSMYGLIAWIKFTWKRYFINAKPLFKRTIKQ